MVASPLLREPLVPRQRSPSASKTKYSSNLMDNEGVGEGENVSWRIFQAILTSQSLHNRRLGKYSLYLHSTVVSVL